MVAVFDEIAVMAEIMRDRGVDGRVVRAPAVDEERIALKHGTRRRERLLHRVAREFFGIDPLAAVARIEHIDAAVVKLAFVAHRTSVREIERGRRLSARRRKMIGAVKVRRLDRAHLFRKRRDDLTGVRLRILLDGNARDDDIGVEVVLRVSEFARIRVLAVAVRIPRPLSVLHVQARVEHVRTRILRIVVDEVYIARTARLDEDIRNARLEARVVDGRDALRLRPGSAEDEVVLAAIGRRNVLHLVPDPRVDRFGGIARRAGRRTRLEAVERVRIDVHRVDQLERDIGTQLRAQVEIRPPLVHVRGRGDERIVQFLRGLHTKHPQNHSAYRQKDFSHELPRTSLL